ncbi:hypothetical protein [Streptomyces hainanensis]|uniref:Uncharacterized protein n=1 Tax=Streptomyces hainanensis TaxID=402648 RepID=A0A4R4TJK8_9ACTN|nr:hypothetical protein [Streptomyces hainanensis]TDC78021.1 hypothetical protein E1283_05990 [Streptomyces hainanensis]
MTDIRREFRELRDATDDARGSWLCRRFPDGVPSQWWTAMLEAAETQCSPRRPLPAAERLATWEFAARLLDLVPRFGGLSPCYVGYWRVRLAAIALRYSPPLDGLPPEFTPDAAVRYTLDHLPLTREKALDAAHRARQGRLHVPGEPITPGQRPPEESARLNDLRWVLPSLDWLVDHLRDDALRRETRAWLDLVPRL